MTPVNHIEYGPLKSAGLDKDDVADFHDVDPKDLFFVNWVKISGTEYRPGLIVCTEMKDEMPVFRKISKIFLAKSEIYFVTDKFTVDCFSEHFHAYEV